MIYSIYKFKKTNKVSSENLLTKFSWGFVGICLLIAYGLPAIHITVNQTIFLYIFIIALILGIVSLVKIHNFEDYRKMYKRVLTESNVYMQKNATGTQAMFMNCDHSMLTYRIYRTPKVILGIFKERLKTLITINLLPAFLIGGGLALLLYLSGGTDNPINYVIQFVSIIAMSIFFSVHYLVMYYLLQPYNVNTEMKSSTYKVVQGLTYIVCWYMIKIQMPIFTFGIAMIVFCIAYCLISLFLAYKYAPKTFKLRI